MMFGFWQKRRERQERAEALVGEALLASRDPRYFTDFGVPDSFDGRFETAVLEMFIRLYTLPADENRLRQAMFDRFFHYIDLTLREMGIGDLSVPRHMKRMMGGFNGRIRHYWDAVAQGDRAALASALARNLYGTAPDTAPETVEKLADWLYDNLSTS